MPQITSPATSRAAWYDRNPVSTNNYVGANPAAAARALTTDWTYTVSAGKKALAEILNSLAINKSTTALNEEAAAPITFTPSGGSETTLFQAYILTGMTSVSDKVVLSPQMTMQAGDALKGKTKSDNTNAGTNVTVATGCKVTEYSA